MNEECFYNQPELWDQPPAAYQQNVLRDILDLLPADARTILDAGCGNGFIANALPEELDVTAVDISREAICTCAGPSGRRRSRNCHLPTPRWTWPWPTTSSSTWAKRITRRRFRKLARVAAKYVLVTVPFMENLAAGRTLCGACGRVYHVNHHQRAFGVRELASLLGRPGRRSASSSRARRLISATAPRLSCARDWAC